MSEVRKQSWERPWSSNLLLLSFRNRGPDGKEQASQSASNPWPMSWGWHGAKPAMLVGGGAGGEMALVGFKFISEIQLLAEVEGEPQRAGWREERKGCHS